MHSMSGLVDVKTRDYLDQDPEIRGQRYVCLSFVSPEDVIKRKEVVFFKNFLGAFSKDVSELFDNIKTKFGSAEGNNDNSNNVAIDAASIVEMVDGLKQRYDYVFDETALGDEFEFYKQVNSAKLETEYLEANDFQTTIRGIKVRGAYDTVPEARNRAEQVKKLDPNFNVYVAEMGCWCPWSPNPEELQNVEYAEASLNTLMKKYKENQDEKNEHFRMRRDEMIKRNEFLNKSKAEANAVENNNSGISVVEDVANVLFDKENVATASTASTVAAGSSTES